MLRQERSSSRPSMLDVPPRVREVVREILPPSAQMVIFEIAKAAFFIAERRRPYAIIADPPWLVKKIGFEPQTLEDVFARLREEGFLEKRWVFRPALCEALAEKIAEVER